MRSVRNILLFTFMTLSIFTNAQTGIETYIKYDADCMKIYSYEKSGDYYGIGFLDFHVKISPHETFIFRVLNQENSISESPKLDKEAIVCQDLRLITKDFIKSVNIGEKIVYFAQAKEKGYTLYTVRKVAHYHETANELIYEDSHLSFTYEYDKIKNGQDLDKSDHRQVNFLDRSKLACATIRTFSSFNNAQANYSEKMQFVEKVGLYKIESKKGALTLKTIDGKDVLAYIQSSCQSTTAVTTNPALPQKESTNSSQKKTNVTTEDLSTTVVFNGFDAEMTTGETTPKLLSGDSPAQRVVVPKGYHMVIEGETIYQIAKMYNTREDVLVGLNDLKANASISHGTLLKVVNDGSYKDPNPIIRKDEATGTQMKIHVVRQGESLWDIAKRYGTTTVKIQKLNQLQDRDKINVRQELLIEKIMASN